MGGTKAVSALTFRLTSLLGLICNLQRSNTARLDQHCFSVLNVKQICDFIWATPVDNIDLSGVKKEGLSVNLPHFSANGEPGCH